MTKPTDRNAENPPLDTPTPTTPNPATPTTDDLLARLTAADPVDPATLPAADDPAPRRLLETIMTSATDNDTPDGGPADDADVVTPLDLPEVQGIERYAPRSNRRLTTMAAVAAAVILVIAGFGLFAPDNSTPALATVHDAAATTANFDTGRISATFIVAGGDDTDSARIGGEVEAAFSGDDLQIVGDITESEFTGPEPIDDDVFPRSAEVRWVDNVLYGNDGTGQWYATGTIDLLGQTVVDLVDPRSVLGTVNELVETTEVGTAVIDGVETTHFRSEVDLGSESLNGSGWLAVEASQLATELQVDGNITVDLYVDGEGVLRQLDVSGDLAAIDEGEGEASFSASTRFHDLGGDIRIEAPADAVELDLTGEGPFSD